VAYDGWLSIAGAEVINAARTKRYVDNLLPTFGLVHEIDCDDLGALLGDRSYSSPAIDDAPWHNPYDARTARFYGLYPLSITGLEDSTSESDVTELTTNGAVAARSRHRSRDVRVTGLLIGDDEGAVEAGMQWLKAAVQGSGCTDGDCGGSTLCYLAYCPEACSYDGADVVPYSVSMETMTADMPNWQVDSVLPREQTLRQEYDGDYTYLWIHAGDSISRRITGLVPGAAYRLSLDISTPYSPGEALRASIRGVASKDFYSSKHYAILGDTPPDGVDPYLRIESPWVMDFVALETEHTLELTGLVLGDASISVYWDMFGVSVRRIPEPLLVFETQVGADAQDESLAWFFEGGDVSTERSVRSRSAGEDIYDSNGMLQFNWRAVNPTTVTADMRVTRYVSGLTAGRRYKARAVVSGTVEASGARSFALGTPTDFGPVVEVPGNYTADLEWEFTATGTTQKVSLLTAEAIPLTATNQYTNLFLHYMRVELSQDGLELVDPDPLLPARRSLHAVTVLQGPRVVQRYSPSIGAMWRVEFILNAGRPIAHSEPVPLGSALQSAPTVIPEQVCQNGQPVLINLVTNPSVETNLTGWSATGLTLARATSAAAVSGTQVARGTAPSTSGTAPTILGPTVNTWPGMLYTVSAYVRSSDFLNVRLGFSHTAVMGSTETLRERYLETREGDMVRLSATILCPPWSFTMRPMMQIETAATQGMSPSINKITAGDWIEVDMLMVTATPAPTLPFDGSSPEAAWTGASHASTSRWAKTGSAVLRDPNCVVIPAAPRAPSVPNSCLEAPTTWLRHTTVIPPSAVPPWSEAVPVVTLTTGASEVRQVRVRFYANPFGEQMADINPCNFCGEFVVSYIPPDSTLTVDGVMETASISVAQTATQPALSLLYGSDGGPVIWPTLSCSIPYVMTVDVSPSRSDGMDVRLAIARRE
jgi:hypothetical protein